MADKTVNGYYGSDLNRFIDKYCSHEMTVNNIDLIIYKVSKKHIRIIESKHEMENMPKSQYSLLQKLARQSKIFDCELEVLIIKGNPPYNTAEIINLTTGQKVVVSQSELIKYLNFEDIKLNWVQKE
jgi:hypothetical protein